MPQRKDKLANFETYHIFCRSIARFKILNRETDLMRMHHLIRFYQLIKTPASFSNYVRSEIVKQNGFDKAFGLTSKNAKKHIQLIAYCFMPTHFHFVIKQLRNDGISLYMRNVMNGYASYFNLRYKRKGPLWESRFKNVRVTTDEQLYHLTRYIHLNPVTAKLVNKPENWRFSSYLEYIVPSKIENAACEFRDLIPIKPSVYKKFVQDRVSYQRELAKIKKLLFD